MLDYISHRPDSNKNISNILLLMKIFVFWSIIFNKNEVLPIKTYFH